MGQETEIDWAAVRQDYEAGGEALRALAARHGVGLARLRHRAKEEDWKRGMPARHGRAALSPGARTLKRLYRLIDQLADQLESRLEGRDYNAAALGERESTAQILCQLTKALAGLIALERGARDEQGGGVPAEGEENELSAEDAWAEVQRRLARIAAARNSE